MTLESLAGLLDAAERDFVIEKQEILRLPAGAWPECPDGWIMHRARIRYNDGTIKYVQVKVDSVEELETQEFWRDYFDQLDEDDED